MAGAWVPGQADNLLRAADTAKMLHLPLVYLLNCSGVEFPNQDKVYPNRRGGGTPFFRNAELNQLGVPVIVGIYGTNPAGGGYHSISPTILIAHKDANMAVGGAGILSGMNPKGYIDEEAAEQIVNIEDIIAAGEDNIAVVIQPIDDTVQSAIQQLVDAEIPYVAFDRIIDGVSSSAVSNVKGDNEGIGAAAAAYFVSEGMTPGEAVYVYEGDTSSVTSLRDSGFTEYLTGELEYDGETIADDKKWTEDDLKSITVFRSNELEPF